MSPLTSGLSTDPSPAASSSLRVPGIGLGKKRVKHRPKVGQISGSISGSISVEISVEIVAKSVSKPAPNRVESAP